MYKLIQSLFIFLLLTTACDVNNSADYQEYVVLEAYAIADRPLPNVWLSTTLPANNEYQYSEAALDGANIQLILLDEDGGAEETFEYLPAPNTKGLYQPGNNSHRILTGRSYRIHIDFDNREEVLEATTTVPEAFQVTGSIPESVVYQSAEQLEVELQTSANIWESSIIVFDAIAEDPVPANLTPFYQDLVDEDEAEIEDLYHNASGLIGTANFTQKENGNLVARYPWSGVAFFGENTIAINSVDKNLEELVQSQGLQFGGGFTLSPGEIPNLRYNVEGGIGIFGSLASDTVRVRFERP